MTDDPPRQVFEGLRVLELSGSIWDEYASKLFADFGADVIKVESPDGSPTRGWRPRPGGDADRERGPLFLHLNTNKRSIALDLERDEDVALVRALVRTCDAMIESGGPGELERVGLAPELLHELNPALTLTRISPFGQTGPYARRTATGLVLQAMGGPMKATGSAGRGPLRKPGNLEHYTVGRAAGEATLAGLIAARRSGVGSVIDVSGHEVLLTGADRRAPYLLAAAYSGIDAPRGVRSAHRGMSMFTGPFQARDGHVMVYITGQEFSDRLLELVGATDPQFAERFIGRPVTLEEFPEYRDHLAAWFRARDKRELMEMAEAARVPLTAYLSMDEILHEEHYRGRDLFVTADHPVAGPLEYLGAPWRMDGGYRLRRAAPLLDQDGLAVRADAEGPPARPAPLRWPDRAVRQRDEPGAPAGLPLRGVRVIDLTVVWAGPGGTALLGDLGAEVIRLDANNRIRRQNSAHLTREMLADAGYRSAAFPDREPQPRPYDRTAMFNWHARNKLAACANLDSDAGREALLALVDISDVLIENNAPATLAKLGIATDDLLARNPRLVVARMPPMGLTGPMSSYVGYGPNFNVLVGIGALEGYEGETVDASGDNYHMDEASPWGIAFAIMAALWARDRSGVGGLIDFAQAENVMQEVGEYLIDWELNARDPVAFGNADPMLLQDVFPCSGDDAWVAISVRDDRDWEALCDVIGDPSLRAEGASRSLRERNSPALRRRVGEWAATRPAAQIVDALVAVGVPVGEVMGETAVLNDPHLAAREWFQTRSHPAVGSFPYPGQGWRADTVPQAFGRPFAAFGEDNDYVYRELLGYPPDVYARLRERRSVTEEQLV